MHKKIGNGHVVRKNFRVGVNYDFDLKRSCAVDTDHDLKDLKMVHTRDQLIIPKGKADVDMSFFLSTSSTNVQEMMESVIKMGLHPAIMAEVDSLRSLKKGGQLDCLFHLADEHARARKVRRDYVDTLCLPVLGTKFQVKGKNEEHIGVMMICRTCGSDKIQLFHPNEIKEMHSAWITPLVAQVA